MKPAARVTDAHVCPMVTGTVPHVGGPIAPPGIGVTQAGAGGLTVVELINRLNELYGQTIKNAQATVIVREIRSRPVYFVGGVGKPGPLQLMQDLTLLQAVSLAGG